MLLFIFFRTWIEVSRLRHRRSRSDFSGNNLLVKASNKVYPNPGFHPKVSFSPALIYWISTNAVSLTHTKMPSGAVYIVSRQVFDHLPPPSCVHLVLKGCNFCTVGNLHGISDNGSKMVSMRIHMTKML